MIIVIFVASKRPSWDTSQRTYRYSTTIGLLCHVCESTGNQGNKTHVGMLIHVHGSKKNFCGINVPVLSP